MTAIKKREPFDEFSAVLPLRSRGMLQSPFIQLDARDGFHNIQLKNILYCSRVNGFTAFHTGTGKPVLVSKPISHFERLLRKYGFKRVNNQYLINLTHILRFVQSPAGYELALTGGAQITVPRTITKDLVEELHRISVKEKCISKVHDWQMMNEDFILKDLARTQDLTFRYNGQL